MAEILYSPDPDLSYAEIADWLELRAFFSQSAFALFDEIENQLDIIEDETDSDFGSADAAREALRSGVYEEVEKRRAALGTAYPFAFSANGERFELASESTLGSASYVFCLILAHAAQSSVLQNDARPCDGAMREARLHFHILCTVAAAGLSGGPSISFGWPRPEYQKTFQDALAVFIKTLAEPGVLARSTARSGAPTSVKDEGIDTISWRLHPDGPPVGTVLFGQGASGHDWETKSARGLRERFLQEWIDGLLESRTSVATFIPHVLSQPAASRHTPTHGEIIHRLRLPAYVQLGKELADKGTALVQRVGDFHLVEGWIKTYRDGLSGRAYA